MTPFAVEMFHIKVTNSNVAEMAIWYQSTELANPNPNPNRGRLITNYYISPNAGIEPKPYPAHVILRISS